MVNHGTSVVLAFRAANGQQRRVRTQLVLGALLQLVRCSLAAPMRYNYKYKCYSNNNYHYNDNYNDKR